MSSVNKTIQDKLKNLQTLIDWFDSDDFVLESSIEKYKEAEKLAAEIELDLKSLKNTVTVVKNSK